MTSRRNCCGKRIDGPVVEEESEEEEFEYPTIETHNTTWTGALNSSNGPIDYIHYGELVFLKLPEIFNTATSTGQLISESPLPEEIRPALDIYIPVVIVEYEDIFTPVSHNTQVVIGHDGILTIQYQFTEGKTILISTGAVSYFVSSS